MFFILSWIKGFYIPSVGESNRTNLILPLAWGTFWILQRNERSPCLLHEPLSDVWRTSEGCFSENVPLNLITAAFYFLPVPSSVSVSESWPFFALLVEKKKQRPGQHQTPTTAWCFWSSSYTKRGFDRCIITPVRTCSMWRKDGKYKIEKYSSSTALSCQSVWSIGCKCLAGSKHSGTALIFQQHMHTFSFKARKPKLDVCIIN